MSKRIFIRIFILISGLTFGWNQCLDGEVDLGWGDCNEFWSDHSDGCMDSGCYSIDETTVINLFNIGYTGQISPEIGNLTQLQYLDLGYNNL